MRQLPPLGNSQYNVIILQYMYSHANFTTQTLRSVYRIVGVMGRYHTKVMRRRQYVYNCACIGASRNDNRTLPIIVSFFVQFFYGGVQVEMLKKSSPRSKFCNIHVILAQPATTDCYLVWRNTVFIELVRSQKSCRYYLEWSHSMGGGGEKSL